MHRRSWQALGGKSLGSGRLRSFSVCSDPGAIIAECTARMRVKKKRGETNFWSEKPQQQVEPSKTSSMGLSPQPIGHLVKMPLCDGLPFPFKCSSTPDYAGWPYSSISFKTCDTLVSDAGTVVTVHRGGDTFAEQLICVCAAHIRSLSPERWHTPRPIGTIVLHLQIWAAPCKRACPALEMEMPCVRIMRFLRVFFGD